PMPELAPVTSALCPFNHSGSGCVVGSAGRGQAASDSTDEGIVLYLLRRAAGSRWNAWLQQLCDQSGPARLMRRAESPAGVTMEMLVELHVVAEVRVVLDVRSISHERAAAALVAEEEIAQPRSELARDLVNGEMSTRARRALDHEIVSVVVVELLERFDD